MRRGVSQLLAIVVIVAITLSVGAFLFAWSIGIIRIGAPTHNVSANTYITRSSSGTYLTVTIKNTGQIGVAGIRVLFDNHIYPINRMTNIGTLFYGVNLEWFEIIGTEDNTQVKFEAIDANGNVAGSWTRTVNKGEHTRFDGWNLWDHRITSDKPIAVFASSIGPHHGSDDDFYSLAGTDLWLWIPAGAGRYGSVFISAYEDDTKITITDYGNGDDTRTFTLNRGQFWEGANVVEPFLSGVGEVWHIEASKPITVMAGYPENDQYEEVKSPYPTEYYFDLIGDNPYVVVEAQEDNTHVTIDNLDGSYGDGSWTLNAGDKIVRYIRWTRNSPNNVEWVRVHVYADKPIEVLDVDPWGFGASQHDFWDYINNGYGEYKLYLIALSQAKVTLSGEVSWSGTINKDGVKILNWIGLWRRIHIESNGYLVIYTMASGWVEGITPIMPTPQIPPGSSYSTSIPLPSSINIYQTHSVTVEVYFVDGSVKEYTLGVKG